MMDFPAPIGGRVMPLDFAPSIIFATLYGLLVPVMLYRLIYQRSRTALLLGTVAFSIERIVVYSLRASQAYNEKRSVNLGLTTYLQISFGLGYIGIGKDMVKLVRCLLVNPTYGSERYPESPAAYTKGSDMQPPPEGTEDHPRTRFWVRRCTGILGLLFVGTMVPGIVASSYYNQLQLFTDQGKTNHSEQTRLFMLVGRIVSAAMSLLLTIVLLGAIAWARYNLSRTSREGAMVLTLVCVCLATISLYRLPNLMYYTTSLSAPTPLDTPRSKAAFYIFHILPEWLSTFFLFAFNVRTTVGTALRGDWRSRDESPKEKEKRLKNVEEKAEKKRAQLEGGKVGYETDDSSSDWSFKQPGIPLVQKVC